jgi:urease accessory protein
MTRLLASGKDPCTCRLKSQAGLEFSCGTMDARASEVLRNGQWEGPAADRIALDYEGRFLRRRRLRAQGGTDFLLDLAEVTSLDHGDALVLTDGRLIEVEAAHELLLEVRGDLPRLAWHIGNRHTPCEIRKDRLLIRRDRVLTDMLVRLGAVVEETEAPFRPEGGAYGHGRTHGHAH